MADLEERSDDGPAVMEGSSDGRSPAGGDNEQAAFDELLEYLWRSRGLDLTGDKRASLMRRIRKRMAGIGIDDFAGVEEYLELHPDEFQELFTELLINVTSVFRDAEAWNALGTQVVAPMLDRKAKSERIRVWSAGCAAGEEAYTLAILLAEAMGREDFRYAFRNDLRRTVIFGRHDLVSGVAWTPGINGTTCDVHFMPLVDSRGSFVGVVIGFTDTTRHSHLQRELEHAHQSLETAYEELQSTNEELETMNAELQSTNEELHSINEVMRGREEELDRGSGFLRSILGSLRGGTSHSTGSCA